MNTVESVFGTRLTRRTAMKGLLAASAAGAFAAHGIGAFAQDATPGVSDYPEVVIVGTEFLTVSQGGIGAMIWQSWTILAINKMMVGLIITGIMGWLLSLLINVGERFVMPWRVSD